MDRCHRQMAQTTSRQPARYDESIPAEFVAEAAWQLLECGWIPAKYRAAVRAAQELADQFELAEIRTYRRRAQP